jgi:hypothetical protein
LFALPVISAWIVFNNPQLLEGTKTKNYGDLVFPAIPSILSEFVVDGDVIDMEHLKGRWVLLHIDLDSRCDESCEKSVHMLRQLNVLLNKDSDRLKRVYLDKSDNETQEKLAKDSSLNVFKWNEQHIEKLTGLLKELNDGDMLLLDPLGNIMMKYHKDADPYGVKKDLKLLFKTSQIG